MHVRSLVLSHVNIINLNLKVFYLFSFLYFIYSAVQRVLFIQT